MVFILGSIAHIQFLFLVSAKGLSAQLCKAFAWTGVKTLEILKNWCVSEQNHKQWVPIFGKIPSYMYLYLEKLPLQIHMGMGFEPPSAHPPTNLNLGTPQV